MKKQLKSIRKYLGKDVCDKIDALKGEIQLYEWQTFRKGKPEYDDDYHGVHVKVPDIADFLSNNDKQLYCDGTKFWYEAEGVVYFCEGKFPLTTNLNESKLVNGKPNAIIVKIGSDFLPMNIIYFIDYVEVEEMEQYFGSSGDIELKDGNLYSCNTTIVSGFIITAHCGNVRIIKGKSEIHYKI